MATPDDAPITQAEYEALAAFRHELRRFMHFGERAANELGLQPRQYQALLAIRAAPNQSLTVGELAALLFIHHHSAVGLADRLEAINLIVRQPGTDDRRKVHLLLTSDGEQILRRLSAVHRRELQRIGPELRAMLRAIGG